MVLNTTDEMAAYNVVDIDGLEEEVFDVLQDDDPEESPLLIFGAPGIGKTAILREAIKRLPDAKDWKLTVKTLSTETADNFFLPKYVKNEVNGKEAGEKSTDVPKDWLPVYKETGNIELDKAQDESLGKGLLFIDELSRAPSQVLSVCLGLVHERIFNGYKVGSGWKIICASNRTEDDMVGQYDMSSALLSRFSIIYFEPSPKKWSEWACTKSYISPLFLQWLQQDKQENLSGAKYFYWDPNEDSSLDCKSNLYCMPRTWDKAFRSLAKKHPKKDLEGFNILQIPEPILKRTLNKHVPSRAIEYFTSYLSTVRVVGDFDALKEFVWHKKGRMTMSKEELEKISLPVIQFILSSHHAQYPTKEEFENLCDWLIDMNSDALTSYALDILFHVFGKGLKNSSHLLTMFGGRKRYDELMKEGTQSAKLRLKHIEESTADWVKNWGWKNLGDCPDWSRGADKLTKAFVKRFESFVINGQAALG